jgi:uncharacterized membrane protein (DUF4010 family)
VALGLGLLIGAERERRKQAEPGASTAGIRTFTVAALAGALSFQLGGPLLLAAATLVLGGLTALGYWRTRNDSDAGLTSEIALVLTLLLGALAMRAALPAAMAGVAVAILLAGRNRIHDFVGRVMTANELDAVLVLAAASLIVLPLLPDRAVGPFDAINPRKVWTVVILVLAIGAGGHVAVRALGARAGLALAGLASGFASSSATIGAMGERARRAPDALAAATAGAVLSTVATVLQMAVVVGVTSAEALRAIALPLVLAGAAAVAYGAVFTLIGLRKPGPDGHDPGDAVSLRAALTFGALLAGVMLAAAALSARFGATGTVAAAAVAGLVDAHAAAISTAALVASGALPADQAALPILAGLSTNTVTKLAFAVTAGGRNFTLRVAPGLILVLAAAWAGLLAG